MSGGRTGAIPLQQMIFIIVTLALIVASSVMSLSGSGFTGSILMGVSDGWQKMDQVRLSGAVSQLIGTGTASTTVVLENDYEDIAAGSDSATLRRSGGATTVSLPPRFDYGGSASGKTVCIRKNGMTVRFGDPPCEPPTCTSRCSATFRSRDTSEDVPNPKYGYICKNGVYEEDDFYRTFYSRGGSSCGGVPGEFAAINAFSCPDIVPDEDDDTATCTVKTSWQCSSGDLTVEVQGPEGTASETLGCGSGIQHDTVELTIDLGDRTVQYQRLDVTATVSGGGDTRTANRVIEYPPRSVTGGPGTPGAP